MCFSIERPLPRKPKNNFWQEFLPAFLLGMGVGEEWESRRPRDGDSIGNGSQEPGGSLWSAWGWGKSLSSLGITVVNHLRHVWDPHYAGQQDTLSRSRWATAASGPMTGMETQQGRLGPVGKRKAGCAVPSSPQPPCPRRTRQPP